jgi:thymidylate kinase
LRDLGYDTFMLFVNTSLDVAQKRNMERARSLDPKEVEKMWNAVQTNIGKFQNYFGRSNFILVDNNDAGEDIFKKLYRQVIGLIRKPVKNPVGKKWIASELEKKKRN